MEIALNEAAPALLVRFRDLCVAIPGEIDEIQILKDVEVDRRGLSRDCAHPRQGFAVEYLVDQRGFPHVGAAGKRDLGALGRRDLLETAVGSVEFSVVIVHVSP